MKQLFSFLIIVAISLPQLYSQRFELYEHDIRMASEVGNSRISWTRSEGGASYISVGEISGVNNSSTGFLGLSVDASKDLSLTADNIIIRGDNISTEKSYSDFAFIHESGSSALHGLTIRNNGNNNNYWTFYTLNGDGNMSLTRNGSVVGTFASNGVYTASDNRMKRDVEPLEPLLNQLLNLRPKKYDYINSKNSRKSIGFIAQDVNEYFPELVLNGQQDDGEVVMQINYAGFGVVAVKAIQEQQEQIESLSQVIAAQNGEIEGLRAQLIDLSNRMVEIEKMNQGE